MLDDAVEVPAWVLGRIELEVAAIEARTGGKRLEIAVAGALGSGVG